MATETAKEHLAFCVERAMEYADRNDWVNAWASFVSDCKKHEGTEHIAYHELTAMIMVSGIHDNPRDFRHFIEGWNVSDVPPVSTLDGGL